jgi:ubiquitin C-terminal hydrolase
MPSEVRGAALKAQYHLVGVVCHDGRSAHAGHYLYYGKRSDVWWKCNDHITQATNFPTVQEKAASEAYGLLYKFKE